MDEEYLWWCHKAAVLAPSIVTLAIIFVMGAIGNICACLVIITTKSLHTHANYYLLTLACSDMVLLFVACPLQVYLLVSCYVASIFVCKFYSYVKEAYGYASILIICAFTAERWLAVCHPLQMNVKLRNLCVAFAAVSFFALSIVAALRANDVSVTKVKKNDNETVEQCGKSESVLDFYTQLIIFVFTYIIPVIMLATMCFQIAVSAHSTSGNARTLCSKKTPSKMIKLLVSVVVSFLICWSPYQIWRLYVFFTAEINKFLWDITTNIAACFFYLNCAVNPILYNMFSKNFRRALLHLVGDGRQSATKAASSASVETNRTSAVTFHSSI